MKEPPKAVENAAKQIRAQDVRGLVYETDIFPPQLLSLENASKERHHHIIWVIRYRLAHPDRGLESFRGQEKRREVSSKWAAWETDASLSQIQQEIATVYEPDKTPQQSFCDHLEEFVTVFEQRRSIC